MGDGPNGNYIHATRDNSARLNQYIIFLGEPDT